MSEAKTKRGLTPVQLEVLIHYFYRGIDVKKNDATDRIIKELQALELVLRVPESIINKDTVPMYKITDKGGAYMAAIRDVPCKTIVFLFPTS
jgi:hypothetical protein